ncbi:glycoside hydrolase family 105 protein [Mycena floridula]|nr:glycoside hydrolase family 105 protein [Mycena floridula]
MAPAETPQGMPTAAETHALIRKLIYGMTRLETDDSGSPTIGADRPWSNWEWTQGVGLYGIWVYYQLTSDREILEIIISWFEARFLEGAPPKNVNTMGAMLTLAYVYEETKEKKWIPYLDAWAEWIMYEMPRTEEGGLQHLTAVNPNVQELWVDTLMMTVLPLAKIGLVLNRPQYIDECEKQLLLHIKVLQSRSGLLYHGWKYTGRHNFSGALWGRGNSWFTIFAPTFISLLNSASYVHPNYGNQGLAASYAIGSTHADKPSGLWHTILDDATPASYLESSCTAGFTFGMLASLRTRLLSPNAIDIDGVRESAYMGIRGLLNCVQVDVLTEGKGAYVEKTSAGTPIFDTKEEYFQVPVTPMPYGQSMVILALVEWLKALQ